MSTFSQFSQQGSRFKHFSSDIFVPPPCEEPLPQDGIRFSVLFDKFANAFFISFYENICVWIASIKPHEETIREDILSRNPTQVRQGLLAYLDKNPWHEDVATMVRESEGSYMWAARSHYTTPENFGKFVFDRIKFKSSAFSPQPNAYSMTQASSQRQQSYVSLQKQRQLKLQEQKKKDDQKPDEVVKWIPVILLGDAAFTNIAGGGTRAVSEGVTLAECLNLPRWHDEFPENEFKRMSIDEIRTQSAQKGLTKFCDLQFQRVSQENTKTWRVHKLLNYVAAPAAHAIGSVLSRIGVFYLSDVVTGAVAVYNNPVVASVRGFLITPTPYQKTIRLYVTRLLMIIPFTVLGPYLAWRAYASG